MPRFANWLIRFRWPALLGTLAAIATLYVVNDAPRVNQSLENMFADDDPALVDYQQLRKQFPGNEVILAVYVDPELFAADGRGLERLAEISRRLQQIRGITNVLSLAEINASLARFDLTHRFLPNATEPLLRANSALASRSLELFEGYTHGADRETVGIACLLESTSSTSQARRETIARIRSVMADLPAPLSAGLVTGEPVMVADGFEYVRADGRKLSWVALGLVAAALAVSLRTIRWTLIAIVVIALTKQLTLALMGILGAELTLVSSMMSAMLTAITVAAVVHVIVRVRECQQAGQTPLEAVRESARLLAAPIFWAAATDAAAFASLTGSRIGPVRAYGLMMTFGALVVPLAIALLVPGLSLLGAPRTTPLSESAPGYLRTLLKHTTVWIERYPRRIVITGLSGAALIIAGTTRLQLETDFTRNFRQDSPLVVAYSFVEERLGGAGVWDIMVPAPDQLDREYVARIARLEQRLRGLTIDDEPALTKVISLVDSIELVGNLGPPELRAQLMQRTMPGFVNSMRACDEQGQCWLRISLRSHERQAVTTKRSIIRQVNEIVAAEFPGNAAQPAGVVTGLYVLLTRLVENSLREQWWCLLISSVAIGATLSIALRSIRLGLLALLTNALPVFTVLGMVGWFGYRVNLGVAMIAAVSLGISVDSSLHWLMDYRRRRQAGATLPEALHAVQQTVGRAVVFSTFALIVGFLSLTTSQFVPTITFGVLTALALLGSLLGNLLLLPALLTVFR